MFQFVVRLFRRPVPEEVPVVPVTLRPKEVSSDMDIIATLTNCPIQQLFYAWNIVRHTLVGKDSTGKIFAAALWFESLLPRLTPEHQRDAMLSFVRMQSQIKNHVAEGNRRNCPEFWNLTGQMKYVKYRRINSRNTQNAPAYLKGITPQVEEEDANTIALTEEQARVLGMAPSE